MTPRFNPAWRCLAVASTLWIAGACFSLATIEDSAVQSKTKPALRLVVMDPLADRLACACVQGHAQRRYDLLAAKLERLLDRPVTVAYGQSLSAPLAELGGSADVLIGKTAPIEHYAPDADVSIHPIAMLTDKAGSTDLTGLFVVRQKDPTQRLEDLKGRRILFGPVWTREKHQAALEALQTAGVAPPAELSIEGSCTSAATAVAAGEADAAVISSYAYPLLEGCKAVARGELRIIGETKPVPFVTVYAVATMPTAEQDELLTALLSIREDAALLKAMESRDGFVALPADSPTSQPTTRPTTQPTAPSSVTEWTDWRGPERRALSTDIPRRLPATARFLWRHALADMSLSGVAATRRFVVVADKEQERTKDVFRCLDANTGAELWALRYDAPGDMDYSNTPRATPVIRDGLVYLLGARGDLHCVELASGKVIWGKNIIKEFGAELVTWGTCSTPLVFDDRVIVNPGAKDAGLVALDRLTGREIWRTPAGRSAYASFIRGRFGGVEQIIGYDADSLGGWDPTNGRRLWTLVPESDAFNVPTPIELVGKLIVTTENNGTRLYNFDETGRTIPQPPARNRELAPDTSTPVLIDGLLFGVCRRLYCLDAESLRTLWTAQDSAYDDYASLIAGNGHVLITSAEGELLLIRVDRHRYELVSRLRLFESSDIWAHPALVGDRLYVRDKREIVCMPLSEAEQREVCRNAAY